MPPVLTATGAVRSCVLLAALFAVGLEGADRLPSLLAGTPHGARVYWTVADAEAGIGARIWLPSSVPPSVGWPPARIDVWPEPPVSVAVHFPARPGGPDGLILVQSIGWRAAPPDAILPRVQVLMTVGDVSLGGPTGTMTRALAPGGQLLHDLSWDQGPRHLVLRYAGPVEDLLQVAGSVERIRP
jgi:hypothetical protein